MDDGKTSAMIALVPITSDWCQHDCPHMTLVYAGELEDLSPSTFNELAKDAASLAMLTSSLYVRTVGVEVFGEQEKVNVIRLQPTPELLAMRRAVERWNASKFPFDPHVTVGPATNFVHDVPSALAFDRIMVGWGEDKLTFWLRR